MKNTLVIAHRGASGYAPENSLSAFRLAMEMQADGIELDIQMTRDGHVVVLHDETIQRTSNGSGFVRDFTLEELKKLDFGSWFSKDFSDEPIPTLREVFQSLSSWKGLLNIEVKNSIICYPGILEKMMEVVSESYFQGNIVYSSFNHESMYQLKKLYPEANTAALIEMAFPKVESYAEMLGVSAIHPYFEFISSQWMDECLKADLKVRTYTVNSCEEVREMKRLGVHAVITNYPDRALEWLKEE